MDSSRSARPDYGSARYNLGLAELRAKHYPAAAAEFDKVVRQDPEHFAAWMNLGIAYSRQKRFEDAARTMARAFELAPDDDNAAVYLARYLKEVGRAKEIGGVYARAERAGAAHPDIYKFLGRLAVKEKNDERAIECYRKTIHLEPHRSGKDLPCDCSFSRPPNC